MLTGRRAFAGEMSDTLAAVLKGDPAWSAAAGAAVRFVGCCAAVWQKIARLVCPTSAAHGSTSTKR